MERTNNFDGLRLFGALAVIVGHAYPLTGRQADVPYLLGFPIQTVGVIVFFSISGYLITASWTRKSRPITYFAARCLRIFPALVIVVLLSVFVLGPLSTTLSMADYFGSVRTFTYLTNAGLLLQHDLPGVFENVPYGPVVNGSLWTLPVEFACYLMVPILCLPRLGRLRLLTLSGFLLTSLLVANAATLAPSMSWDTPILEAMLMWSCFAAGALLRVLSEGQRHLFRVPAAVALLATYAVLAELVPEAATWTAWLAVPYAVLTVGLASTPYLRRAARFGDLSYGLYLYAFQVQQLVVLHLGVLPVGVDIALVAAVTLCFAAASWHAVEHPSLRLKDRIVRRFEPTALRAPAVTAPTLAAETPELDPAGTTPLRAEPRATKDQ